MQLPILSTPEERLVRPRTDSNLRPRGRSLTSPIYRLNATDNDTGSNGAISYRIVGETCDDVDFGLLDGALHSLKDLKKSPFDSCTITIEAIDGGSPPLSSTLTVFVDVFQGNQHDPEISIKFHPSDAKFIVVGPEDTAGKTLAVLSVTDADSSASDKPRLEMISDADLFRLVPNPHFYVLQLKDPSLAQKSPYDVKFMAFDGQNPERSSTKVLKEQEKTKETSLLKPLNKTYVFFLDETTPLGSKFGILPPSDDVIYRTDLTNSLIDVFPDGVIYLSKPIDRRESDVIQMTISRNHRSLNNTQKTNIVVVINRANLHAPNCGGSIFHVKENQPEGSFVGVLTAFDEDIGLDGYLAYRQLDGRDQVFFWTRRLERSKPSNLSTRKNCKTSHLITSSTILAHLEKSTKCQVTVIIDDLNDKAPIFENRYYLFETTNFSSNTSVGNLKAEDLDVNFENRDLEYQVVNGSQLFEVNPKTGEIFTRGALKGDQMYNITIRAVNLAPPYFSTDIFVLIKTGVDLNVEPRLLVDSTILIYSNDQPGAKLAQLKAFASNLPVTWSTEDSRFYLDTWGNVYLNEKLPRSSETSEFVTFVASTGQKKRDFEIEVKFLDGSRSEENDIETVFVKENQKGAFITTVAPSFSLSNVIPGPLGNFELTENGIVKTAAELDREIIDEYFLFFSNQTDKKIIRVVVEDVDDNVSKCASVVKLVDKKETNISFTPKCEDIDGSQEYLEFRALENVDLTENRVILKKLTGPVTEVHVLAVEKANSSRSTSFTLTAIVDEPSDDVRFPSESALMLLSSAHPEGSSFGRVAADSILPVRYFVLGESPIEIESNTGELTALKKLYEDVEIVVLASVETGVAKMKVKVEGIEDRLRIPRSEFLFIPKSLRVGAIVGIIDSKRDDVDIEVLDPHYKIQKNRLIVRQSFKAEKGIYQVREVTARKGRLSAPINISILVNSDEESLNYWIVENCPVGTAVGVLPRELKNYKFKEDIGLEIDKDDVIRTKILFDHEEAKLHTTWLVDEFGREELVNFFSSTTKNDNSPRQIFEIFFWTDSDDANLFRLEIVHGDPFDQFEVDHQGFLRLKRPLDREIASSHNLTINLCDGVAPFKYSCTTTQFSIEVLDVNDNSPSCDDVRFYLMDDVKIGDVIGRVPARDHDFDEENRHSMYRILPKSLPHAQFIIDAVTGDIKVHKNVSRGIYEMRVRVTDDGEPRLSGECQVSVDVRFEEKNGREAPIFVNYQEVLEVKETAKRGTVITKVVLNPEDGYVFKLTSEDDLATFLISPVDGTISVNGPLDFERRKSYNLTISAVPLVNDAFPTISRNLLINLIDENDESPRFITGDLVHFFVEENFGGSFPMIIGSSIAEDLDEGICGQLTYSVLHGNTSQVLCLGPLDREEKKVHEIVVEAMDGGEPRRKATATIIIHALDVNDNAPEFEQPYYFVRVKEDLKIGSAIASITAMDPDEAENSTILYKIQEKDVPFEIDPANGNVKLLKKLDRESRGFWKFTVTATDQAKSSLSSSVDVTIKIDDVNDESPIVINELLDLYVPNTVQPGDLVAVVDVKDDDLHDVIRYELAGVDVDYFSVNEKAEILCAQQLVSKSYFAVSVHVADRANHTTSASFTFYIQPASLFPKWVERLPSTSVEEHQAGNSVVFQAKPHSGGKIRYSLISPCRDHLKIDQTSGVLSSLKTLDREQHEICHVWIVAQHETASPSTSSLTYLKVEVIDVNDEAPVFTEVLYKMNVMENLADEVVGKVLAEDPDQGQNSVIKYSIISGDPRNEFEIDQNGMIRTKKELDREKFESYRLIIRAEDQGVPALSSTAVVEISVLDEDDNAPRFSRIFHVEVMEDVPVGSLVVHLSATDPDGPANHSFSIVEPSEVPFRIEKSTGDVFVSRALDREENAQYRLTVQLDDGVWSIQTRVVIVILDVNDNLPVFEEPSSLLMIEVEATDVLGILKAHDLDEGENGRISYEQVDLFTSFRVEADSGVVTRLQKASMKAFQDLNVVARDNGVPSKSSQSVVTVVSKHLLKNFLHFPVIVPELPYNIGRFPLSANSNLRFWPSDSMEVTPEGELLMKKSGKISVFDDVNLDLFEFGVTVENLTRRAPEIEKIGTSYQIHQNALPGTSVGKLSQNSSKLYFYSLDEEFFDVKINGTIFVKKPLTFVGIQKIRIDVNDGIWPLINETIIIELSVIRSNSDVILEKFNWPITMENENICDFFNGNRTSCVVSETAETVDFEGENGKTIIQLFEMRPQNPSLENPIRLNTAKRALMDTILFQTSIPLILPRTEEISAADDVVVVKKRLNNTSELDFYAKDKFSRRLARSKLFITTDDRAPWPTFVSDHFNWTVAQKSTKGTQIHQYPFLLPNDARLAIVPIGNPRIFPFCVSETSIIVCGPLEPGIEQFWITIETRDGTIRTRSLAYITVTNYNEDRIFGNKVFIRENSKGDLTKLSGFPNATYHIADDYLRKSFSLTEQGHLSNVVPLNAESRSVYRIPITINQGKGKRRMESVTIFVDDEVDSPLPESMDLTIYLVRSLSIPSRNKFTIGDASPASLDSSKRTKCVPSVGNDYTILEDCSLIGKFSSISEIVSEAYTIKNATEKYTIRFFEEEVEDKGSAISFRFLGGKFALAEFVRTFREAYEDMKIHILAAREHTADEEYEVAISLIDRNDMRLSTGESRRTLQSFIDRTRPSYLEPLIIENEVCDDGFCLNGASCQAVIKWAEPSKFLETRQNSTVFLLPVGQLEPSCKCPPSWTGDRCETEISKKKSPEAKKPTSTNLCEDVACGEGECVVIGDDVTCRCHDGFVADHCDHALTSLSLSGSRIELLPLNETKMNKLLNEVTSCNGSQSIELDFRLVDAQSKLLTFEYEEMKASVEIIDGRITYVLTDDQVRPVEMQLDGRCDDGEWHRLQLEMTDDGKLLSIQIDGKGKEAKSRVALPRPFGKNQRKIVVGDVAPMCLRRFLAQRQLVFPSAPNHMFNIVTIGEVAVGCPLPPTEASNSLLASQIALGGAFISFLCVLLFVIAVISWRYFSSWRNNKKTCWEDAKEINAFTVKREGHLNRAMSSVDEIYEDPNWSRIYEIPCHLDVDSLSIAGVHMKSPTPQNSSFESNSTRPCADNENESNAHL
ncbi:unnamed protein product [Caenorhabditis auriculariae]|uniref:Uncharacterized protein n=1 Tax=Caenorhabditis auriculariae TaxID=2777116 RepID=A0A8S1GSC6_9PELO|nr:unnamed protein product [Caenorhabditis auriculariae]